MCSLGRLTSRGRSSPTVTSWKATCGYLIGAFFLQAEDGIRDWTVTGVQTCALPIWNAFADRDHCPPLGEARAHLEVLGHALGEAVEAVGHLLAGRERELDRPLVDLDAGDDAFLRQVLGKGRAVGRLLARRFVEQDHPRDVLLDPRRAEEQPAVGAPVLLGAFDTHRLEALLAGAARLVGGAGALALRHHRGGGFGKKFLVHRQIRGLVAGSNRGRILTNSSRTMRDLFGFGAPCRAPCATSPSSPTSTTARPRWSTNCCSSRAPLPRTSTSRSASWTRTTSSASAASPSWPRTAPSATAAPTSTSSTPRGTRISAARWSARCPWSTACCCSWTRSRGRCRRRALSCARRSLTG